MCRYSSTCRVCVALKRSRQEFRSGIEKMRERQKTMVSSRMLLASSLLLFLMIEINMTLGQLYPLPNTNITPKPVQPDWKYSKPIRQQPTYNTWLPEVEVLPSNTIQPGYYNPQGPQIIDPRQQFLVSPTFNTPLNNDVKNNQLHQFVNPMQNFRPATNFANQKMSLLQQPESSLQNFYPTKVSPPLNSERSPQMNIPYRYPSEQIPYNGFKPMYTQDSLPIGVIPQQQYPQYPHIMHQTIASPMPGMAPMEPIRQPYPDDDFDETDNINENINTNIKDSKFLQMIMQHLQGLMMKDDEEPVQPKDEN